MLEIILSNQSCNGKTTHLTQMAFSHMERLQPVLYVCHTRKRAAEVFRTLFDENCEQGLIKVIAAVDFNHIIRYGYWHLVIFDGYEMFPPNSEGSYIQLAKTKLNNVPFGTVAYTFSYRLSHYVSTSVWWKPWTWGTGYWED